MCDVILLLSRAGMCLAYIDFRIIVHYISRISVISQHSKVAIYLFGAHLLTLFLKEILYRSYPYSYFEIFYLRVRSSDQKLDPINFQKLFRSQIPS